MYPLLSASIYIILIYKILELDNIYATTNDFAIISKIIP